MKTVPWGFAIIIISLVLCCVGVAGIYFIILFCSYWMALAVTGEVTRIVYYCERHWG